MPATTCSLCGTRPRGKMASFYWAKFDGGNARIAWKQRLCKPCYERDVQTWYERMIRDHAEDQGYKCVLCDEADPNNMVPLFLTAYIPNEPMEREGIDVCLSHAPAFEELARRGGEALVDRQPLEIASARATGW